MKQGISIQNLAKEVSRLRELKRDYVCDTDQLRMDTGQENLILKSNGVSQNDPLFCGMGIRDTMHIQMGNSLGIPRKYYYRMLAECPNLLTVNVNHWFQNTKQRKMVRTIEGKARAFLSDRYRILDNEDVFNAILPIMSDFNGEKQLEISTSQLTDSHMYIKALCPKIEREVKKGDVVQGGLVISNSEIGWGSLKVEPLVYRLVCSNGMVMPMKMKKYHVGRQFDVDESIYHLLSNETRRKTNEAIFSQISDLIKYCTDEEFFEPYFKQIKDASNSLELTRPTKSMEVISKTYNFDDDEAGSILDYLASGGDMTRWGLSNAVTQFSQDVDSFNRSIDLERIGGEIMSMNDNQWKAVATN